MYIFNFAQRFIKPCMGHFFVVRNENVPNVDTSMTADMLKNMKGTGYKLVFGGEYGKFIDVSELSRSLQRSNSENGTYKFRSGDVMILVANHAAYAYVLHSEASYYINKNTFAEECARDFGNTYLRWSNRNLLFSACTCERAGMDIYDGYAIEVYDEKDRLLLSDRCESVFQNWFVLLNQALMELKEPVYDEYYHTFNYRTAGSKDMTSLVPERPEAFFYVTDDDFVKRSICLLEEEKKERQTAEVHRVAMQKRYADRVITPDAIEGLAWEHIMKELDYRADEPIAIKDVIFHSFSEEGNEAVANVVVAYDSTMTECYVRDLLCAKSCTYSKGAETVYVKFSPIRKEETGTFADCLFIAKTGVSRKKLLDEGIETLYNGQTAYILLTDIKKEMSEDGEFLPIYDVEGTVLGTVKVYVWNCEVPYTTYPVLFAELGGDKPLTMEQRYKLIKLFDSWYGNTDQRVSEWALEFQLLTRMLIDSNTKGALLINPKFLAYEDDLYDAIRNIIWPENLKAAASGATNPFWIGCTDNETGTVIEVHTEEEAKNAGYHTSYYFSEETENKVESCMASYFWIMNGAIILDPEAIIHSVDEGEFLLSRIARQIRIVAPDAAVLLKELTTEELEKAMHETAAELVMYEKQEHPAEWQDAAERWNALVDCDAEMAKRVLKEYGL